MTPSRPMPRIRTLAALVLAGVVAIGCTPEGANEDADSGQAQAPAGSDGGPVATVAAPLSPDSAEIAAYLTIPNLDATLKGIAAIAAAVAPTPPGASGPDQLKAQLGMMLGDPQLTNLDTSRPIVIAVLGPAAAAEQPLPRVVGLIPAKQASPYDQALAARGMQAKFAEGLLAVALTPGSLEAAASARTLYGKIAGEELEASARLHLGTRTLLATYGPLLTQQINMLPMLIGAAAGGDSSLSKILKAELLSFMTVLEQCDALEIDLRASGAGLQVDSRIGATPGSALAKLFSASRASRPPTTSYLEGSSPMAMAFSMDPESASAFADAVVSRLAADPDCASLVGPDLKATMKTWADSWGGTGAMAMRPTGNSVSIDYILDVKDSEKFYSVLETSAKLMAPGSAFGDMYKGMGLDLSASFERNAREHSGVSIHRWKTSGKASEAAAGNPFASGVMQNWVNQEMGIASVGKVGLISTDAAKLDRMIDAAKKGEKGSPLKLKSQEVFGAGRHGYIDYDVFAVLKALFASLPEDQPGAAEVKRAAERMSSSSSPLIMSYTFGPGRALFQFQAPVALFRDFATMAQSAMAPPLVPPPGAGDGR